MIDHDRLAQMAARDPRVHAYGTHDAAGAAMVTRLIERVRATYRHISPEQLTDGLTIVEPLDPTEPSWCIDLVSGRLLQQLDEIPDHYRESLTIIPVAGGGYLTSSEVLPPDEVPEPQALYHFRPEVGEMIRVAGRSFVPENPTHLPSAFAIPTFFTLEAALRRYAVDCARHGQLCGLVDIWRDPARLMFRAAPEEQMRRSLESFLVASLRETREIDVRPEATVDESHPVDLRVVFTHTARALIEIKWMGDSAQPDGSSHVTYRDARAKSGAKQLADYLEADKPRSTGHVVVGYLVVFDARRRGITPDRKAVSVADGLHYRDREVDFQEDIISRPDFAEPLRMFMEPVCS